MLEECNEISEEKVTCLMTKLPSVMARLSLSMTRLLQLVNVKYGQAHRLNVQIYDSEFLNLRKTDCLDVVVMTRSFHVDIRYGWALDPWIISTLTAVCIKALIVFKFIIILLVSKLCKKLIRRLKE